MSRRLASLEDRLSRYEFRSRTLGEIVAHVLSSTYSIVRWMLQKSTRFVRTKPLPVEGIQDIIERARAMIGTY